MEESARAWHEMWQMNAEHVAGRRRDLVLKFLSESEKSREALAFSWRSVQQMENRDAEDWTQVSFSVRWLSLFVTEKLFGCIRLRE